MLLFFFRFVKDFQKKKEDLTKHLFTLYNSSVFDNKASFIAHSPSHSYWEFDVLLSIFIRRPNLNPSMNSSTQHG